MMSRWFVGALCAAALLLNTGCVYWRLNQFRHQLSSFPENFQIEEGELPAIVAVKPILRPDDFGWLSGLAASDTVVRDEQTTELYLYRKQYRDPADDEDGAYDKRVAFLYNEDQRMHTIEAPARFAPLLTEENFDVVFRPMKEGRVDRGRHATGWFWEEHRVNIPVREDILHFFGVPYAVEERAEGLTYTYAYRVEGNEEEWNPTGWDVYVRFVFEPEEEQVIYTEAYKGRLHIQVDLRAKENLVEIRRHSPP